MTANNNLSTLHQQQDRILCGLGGIKQNCSVEPKIMNAC